MIIPLQHIADGFSITEQELRDSESLIRSLSEKISKKDPSVTGFSIGMNIGESAGQTVFHTHIHLTPGETGTATIRKAACAGSSTANAAIDLLTIMKKAQPYLFLHLY